MANEREAFQSKIWSKAVGHAETFLIKLQTKNDRSKYFSVPTFCSFWESWCEGPSCGRCDIFSRTRNLSHLICWWKQPWVWNSNRSQHLRGLATNLSCFKNKLVKVRGFDTYKKTETKKEHKEVTVFSETVDNGVDFKEEGERVLILLLRTILYFPFFLLQNCLLTTTKPTIRTDFISTNLIIPAISKVPWQKTRGFEMWNFWPWRRSRESPRSSIFH